MFFCYRRIRKTFSYIYYIHFIAVADPGGCARTPLERKIFTFSSTNNFFLRSAALLKTLAHCTAPPYRTSLENFLDPPLLHRFVFCLHQGFTSSRSRTSFRWAKELFKSSFWAGWTFRPVLFKRTEVDEQFFWENWTFRTVYWNISPTMFQCS
jgi:hypothetical protein